MASSVLVFAILFPHPLHAVETCYDGICFPGGDVSFADIVIRYDASYSGGCTPTHSNFLNPDESIGPPNYSGGGTGTGSVSLGSGGLLEVRFVDNALTNSGDGGMDLHIYEVGPAVEGSFIAVRPADAATKDLLDGAGLTDVGGDGFYEVGSIGGSTASLDLDAWAMGFSSGQLKFDAVQIIDDIADNSGCGQTIGADIDAVGAIESAPPVQVEPASWGRVKTIYR